MENQLTPPEDDKTPEQIQADMNSTRESMTEKISALENQVVGTVQTAADTVSGTVQSVKSLFSTAPGAVSDTVKQAVSAVGDTMKEMFDVTGHVRSSPLAAVGVSAGLGFVTGLLVFRRESLGFSRAVARPAYAGAATASTTSAAPAPAAERPSRFAGMFDDMLSMVGRKLREVAENAIDSASKAVNQNVKDGVPRLVDAAAGMAAGHLTPGPGGDGARPGDRLRGAGFGTGSDYTG